MSATSVFTAWLAGEARAKGLFAADPRDPAQRREAMVRAAARRIAPRVLEVMRSIARRLPQSDARDANLQKLARGECAVVVTGQQVGLYLGPLYTLWKAASAIRLAETLERETGIACVPMFWAATEDHDAREVDHCFVPGARGPVRLSVTLDDDARTPVGPRPLPALPREELEDLLDGLPEARAVLALVDAHYREGMTLGHAFEGLVAQVFARHGLLVFDPREPGVAPLATPIYRRAFSERATLERLLVERCGVLESAGLVVQVPPRSATTLFFHHVDGARHRLVERDGRFTAPGVSLDSSALLDRLVRDPSAFSSSALLRPLVQDSLLPTVAYVGGPAEVGYLAELAPLYRHLDVPMPLVVPRARLTLLEPRARRALERVGCTVAQVPSLQVSSMLPEASRPDAMLAELEAHLVALERREPSLHRAIERTRGTVTRAVDRLAAKHAGLLARRDDTALERVTELQRALFPDGAPQERVHSFLSYAARIGVDTLIDAVLAAIDPLDPAPRELAL